MRDEGVDDKSEFFDLFPDRSLILFWGTFWFLVYIGFHFVAMFFVAYGMCMWVDDEEETYIEEMVDAFEWLPELDDVEEAEDEDIDVAEPFYDVSTEELEFRLHRLNTYRPSRVSNNMKFLNYKGQLARKFGILLPYKTKMGDNKMRKVTSARAAKLYLLYKRDLVNEFRFLYKDGSSDIFTFWKRLGTKR